jgi:hypothetical protein
LGLIPEKPVLNPLALSNDVLSALAQGNRSSTIGIIALNDIVPSGGITPKVRPLAFRATNQMYAFYPSSTSTASDLINVRDGHYAVWGNLHFFARTPGGVFPVDVQTVMDLLDGKEATSAVAKTRAIPKCAMQVSRDSDGGDFKLFTPVEPCGCFFEQEASGTAPPECKACSEETSATDCGPNMQCVFDFCEAK